MPPRPLSSRTWSAALRAAAHLALACALALTAAACSEVAQTADDCISGQYFDSDNDLCLTCPAVTLPDCPSDCGYVLQDDALGCAEAICSCDVCAEGTTFDVDAFACIDCPVLRSSACAAGCPVVGTTHTEDGCPQDVCACETTCEPSEAPDCGAEGCCSVVSSLDSQGCPVQTCQCPDTPPEGFYVDVSGVCQTCEGADPVPEACAPETTE